MNNKISTRSFSMYANDIQYKTKIKKDLYSKMVKQWNIDTRNFPLLESRIESLDKKRFLRPNRFNKILHEISMNRRVEKQKDPIVKSLYISMGFPLSDKIQNCNDLLFCQTIWLFTFISRPNHYWISENNEISSTTTTSKAEPYERLLTWTAKCVPIIKD